MKSKISIIFAIILIGMGMTSCKGKDETEQIRDYKANVYAYMFASQSVAVYIADNITDFEKGLRYLDTSTGTMNGSHGEYCYNAKDMVTMVRDFYKAQKAVDVIRSYKSEAKRTMPDGKADLARLYKIAEEMEVLAFDSQMTHTYPNKYSSLLEEFANIFVATDATYPNTQVNYDEIKDSIDILKVVLRGAE